MSKKQEVSVAGAVAGYNSPLSGAPIKKNMSKPFDKKKRKKMKKKRKVPYDILDEQSHNVIRDTIFKVILEGKNEDKIGYIMSLFEGINKQMSVSMSYSKNFITDGLKMGELDKAKKLSFRRAKTELKHVKRLIDDLDMLINQIYEISERREEEGDDSSKEEIAPVVAAIGRGALGLASAGVKAAAGAAGSTMSNRVADKIGL